MQIGVDLRCACAVVFLLLTNAGCGGEDELGPPIPASIVAVPNEPRVPLHETRQLNATVVDSAGDAIGDQPLAFTSRQLRRYGALPAPPTTAPARAVLATAPPAP